MISVRGRSRASVGYIYNTYIHTYIHTYIYVYIYIYIYIYTYIYIYIYIERERVSSGPCLGLALCFQVRHAKQSSALAFTRYSFTSRLLCTHQPSFHSPRPLAFPTLVQYYCTTIGQYTTPLPTSHLYAIHHTISVLTRSCKGQAVPRPNATGHSAVPFFSFFW